MRVLETPYRFKPRSWTESRKAAISLPLVGQCQGGHEDGEAKVGMATPDCLEGHQSKGRLVAPGSGTSRKRNLTEARVLSQRAHPRALGSLLLVASEPSETILGVIASHALWSQDGELRVWGEQSSMPTRSRRRPGRPRDAPSSRAHPFACRGANLRQALGRLSAGVAAEAVAEGRLALRLPSSELGPQASPHLLRVVEDDTARERALRLEPWEVDALRLPATGAVDLLPWCSAFNRRTGRRCSCCR